MSTSQAHGALGEQIACDFLLRKKYAIRERNYRIPGGEIDIIAQNGDIFVFVEVKTRESSRYGYPEEAVDSRKLRKMSRAIRHYLSRFGSEPLYRIDVVSISFDYAARQAHLRHIMNIEVPFWIT